MFDITASIVLVVSLVALTVLFLKKQRRLLNSLDKKSYQEEDENGEPIGQLEILDKKINSFLEFFLRKIRTLILKSDNTISKWIHSLKKENGNQVQEMFFIEEQIVDGDLEIEEEAVVKIKKKKKKFSPKIEKNKK